MDISLRQLEAFVKVAEHRSFSQAGEELFLSQSTVSSHIARLEQVLQTTLIRRREKKKIELTEDGVQAYRMALLILNQAEMLENTFHREEKDSPLISIAASSVPSSYILPDIMSGFSASHPACKFSMLDGDSSFAIDRIQNGEAVFAFVGTASRKSLLQYHTICRDKIVLIAPNTEAFAQKKAEGASGRELLGYPMIIRENGSGTRKEADNYLKSIGKTFADLNVTASMNNIEGIKSMVASGGGITLLSERAANDAIQAGRVLCFDLEEDGPYRDIFIAYMKNRTFTRTEQEFLSYVKKLGGKDK
ncbi:MAG: selenium metabolism-associated LysR family transcriptional regulator [Clostridia bacterium]|nr:selenium metabolism-associated LysR family transcriptional regulator [Clostridia bacterium]